MRILQLIQKSQNRGAEIFSSQLSNHLVDLGHSVKMVALFPGDSELPFLGEIIKLNASSRYRMVDFKAWKKLAEIINSFKPDIVQANAGDTLKYAVFSQLLFGWKAKLISRNASEIGQYLGSLSKIYNGFLYRNVDKVISVSMASQKDILMQFPFLENRTEVIPVGLEVQEEIKEIKFEPEGAKHIVHVGGFTFEKNHSGLFRIFQKVLEIRNDVHLHLVGNGPLRQEMEALAAKMNLGEKVHFYGFVNNPLSYIKGGNVLVLPSIIEGLPGVLLEGMYCGTPVVAYDVGGISEIINESTGDLIKKNEEGDFVLGIEKILRASGNEKLVAARLMVEREYMNCQLALKFVKSFQNLLSKKIFK